MGCDIHLHIEIKINDTWHHYSHPHVTRNYGLFAKMAGVRNHGLGIIPIAMPKGLPDDITELTKYCFDRDNRSYYPHDISWLGPAEIAELEDWLNETYPGDFGHDLEHSLLHCYLFGNSFAGFHKYPEEREPNLTDLRFVFWFDN